MHERAVVRVATRLTGSFDEAKEIAQEVFLKLYKALGSIDDNRGLAPWLYRVTVNAANDELRKRRVTAKLDEAYAAPGARGPEEVALDSERRNILMRAIGSLPEKERAALVLRDVEGLSTAEVASILGIAEVTVRSQISSARVKLRRIVNVAHGRRV
jgi:RNA polymerase sigma-70 factor (ECF subfamily)